MTLFAVSGVLPGWSFLRRDNKTNVQRLQTLPRGFAWSSGVERLKQQLQGEITSYCVCRFINSVVTDSLDTCGVLHCAMWHRWCLVVVAGRGEGPHWPAFTETTNMAGWAEEAGGGRGGVSRDGNWSQRSSPGMNGHELTDETSLIIHASVVQIINSNRLKLKT